MRGRKLLPYWRLYKSAGLFIKKESPNKGTEKVRLEFSRALMNQFRDLHVDYI